MTDKHGTDGNNEPAAHDDMTEAETWQDDQPPVDDFADQPLEETATVSEEEGELPDDDQSGMVIDEKKRSLMLPIAAGLGGMLFLGAVLYWQFGTSPPAAPAIKPPPLSTAQIDTPAPAPLPAPHPTPASNTNSGNTDISNLGPSSPNVAPTTALAPPAETPSAPSPATAIATPAPTTGVAVPAPSPSVAPVVPQPAILSAETLAKAPPVPMAVAPVLAPPITVAPMSAAKGDTLDARLSALTAHVEDLQKALAQTTQQLSQISNMVAAKMPASPQDSAIENRLNKIEQQVLQIQHAEPVTAASPVVTQETSTAVVADATPEKPAVKSTVSTHKRKVPPKPSHVTRKVSSTKSAKTSSHWTLRAATPNEAWVSNGDSSDEFRHVQVGDTLAGIGRIEAIRQTGDNWTIEGTQGSVH